MKWLSVLFVSLFLMAMPAMAEDGAAEKAPEPVTATDNGFQYAPEGCEFAMTFPTEPYNGRSCNPDDPSDCRPQTTYTKVFDGGVTVTFNVTCNPVPADTFDRYSGDVMEVTLAAMASKNRLDKYETGFQQFGDDAKQAVILGTGKTGDKDKLFVSQIWIGHKSLFTAEAEIVGPATDEEETFFAKILATIHNMNWTPEKQKAAEAEKKKSSKKKPAKKAAPPKEETAPAPDAAKPE